MSVGWGQDPPNWTDNPGAYSITWDAAKISSGVYFVHFTATGESMAAVSQIQKLMLIK